jgi:hypothetical protein
MPYMTVESAYNVGANAKHSQSYLAWLLRKTLKVFERTN